ncbi:hypothetical protein NDN08_000058 [Rhodosorus marinus]|uniref:Uncharacterized protein n=1 Tax=Rhodosorus marinus TaxID=101924 RepID=A0AAV8UHS6_9RHOD|nr:hypothetical protein NDN08_000058 [Rhodosorus marinus]
MELDDADSGVVEFGGRTDSRSRAITVVVHADSAAAMVECSTGQVLFRNLQQAMESCVAAILDMADDLNEEVVLSIVIGLSVDSIRETKCVVYREKSFQRSQIFTVLDPMLFEAQVRLSEMIQRSSLTNSESTSGLVLLDLVRAGLVCTPPSGGEVILVTVDEYSRQNQSSCSALSLVSALISRRTRLSAIIGHGSGGIGNIRDNSLLKFVSRASGGVMTNAHEVRLLRHLFSNGTGAPRIFRWSSSFPFASEELTEYTDDSSIELTDCIQHIRTIQSSKGADFPWKGHPPKTALMEEVVRTYVIDRGSVDSINARRFSIGFFEINEENLIARAIERRSSQLIADMKDFAIQEMLLPLQPNVYILSRIAHRDDAAGGGGKAVVQLCLCANVHVLRLFRPRRLAKQHERYLLTSMSEKVTLKLSIINKTVARIQKVDTSLSLLCAVPRNPGSDAITTILLNSGIGRADWQKLFDVRAFHAVSPSPLGSSQGALDSKLIPSSFMKQPDGTCIALKTTTSNSSDDDQQGYSFVLLSTESQAPRLWTFTLAAYRLDTAGFQSTVDEISDFLVEHHFEVFDLDVAPFELLGIPTKSISISSYVSEDADAEEDQLASSLFRTETWSFDVGNSGLVLRLAVAIGRSRKLVGFIPLDEELPSHGRKQQYLLNTDEGGVCFYVMTVGAQDDPYVSCMVRVHPKIDSEKARSLYERIREEDTSLSRALLTVARAGDSSSSTEGGLPEDLIRLIDPSWVRNGNWCSTEMRFRAPSGLLAASLYFELVLEEMEADDRSHRLNFEDDRENQLSVMDSGNAAEASDGFQSETTFVLLEKGLSTLPVATIRRLVQEKHAEVTAEAGDEDRAREARFMEIEFAVLSAPLAWISGGWSKDHSGAVLSQTRRDTEVIKPIIYRCEAIHRYSLSKAISMAIRKGWSYSSDDLDMALKVCSPERMNLEPQRFLMSTAKVSELHLYRATTSALIRTLVEESRSFTLCEDGENHSKYCFTGRRGALEDTPVSSAEITDDGQRAGQGGTGPESSITVEDRREDVEDHSIPPIFLIVEKTNVLWVYRGPSSRSSHGETSPRGHLDDLIYVLRAAVADISYLRDGRRSLSLSVSSFVVFEEFYESFGAWLTSLGLSEKVQQGFTSHRFIDMKPNHPKLSMFLKESAGRQWKLSLYVWTEAGTSLLEEDHTQRTALRALLGCGSFAFDYEVQTAYNLIVAEDKAKISMGLNHVERLLSRPNLPIGRHAILVSLELEIPLEQELTACRSTIETVMARLVGVSLRLGVTNLFLEESKSRRIRAFINPAFAVPGSEERGFLTVKIDPQGSSMTIARARIRAGLLANPSAEYVSRGLEHVVHLRRGKQALENSAEAMVRRMIGETTAELTRDRLWTDLFLQSGRSFSQDEKVSQVHQLRTLVTLRRLNGETGISPEIHLPTQERDGITADDVLTWLEKSRTHFHLVRTATPDGTPVALIVHRRHVHLALLEIICPTGTREPELYIWAKTASPKCEAAGIDTITAFVNVLCLFLWHLSAP